MRCAALLTNFLRLVRFAGGLDPAFDARAEAMRDEYEWYEKDYNY